MNCGYLLIPYIYKGQVNKTLTADELLMAERAMSYLEKERVNHRLAENYTYKRLHLDQMFLYNIIYDTGSNLPVFVSGTQVVGKSCVRVFSRYFVFENYKTQYTHDGLFKKVDDFEELGFSLKVTEVEYPLVIWSRDKGEGFFRRLIRNKPEVFKNWILHKNRIEFLYPDNFQNILYLNRGLENVDEVIESELVYKI